MAQHYTDHRPIAFAEMAAALKGLIWFMRNHLQQPTTITLATDSSTVYYILQKGTGLTLRSSEILQKLYVTMMYEQIKSGNALVVRWVPSEQNLADPLTRENTP
jgi:ribonuclease HI